MNNKEELQERLLSIEKSKRELDLLRDEIKLSFDVLRSDLNGAINTLNRLKEDCKEPKNE